MGKEKNKQDAEQKEHEDALRIKELTETLQRLQADFENYKKRVDKEKQEFMQFATKEFFKLTLPIVDNFELAFMNEQSHEDFKKGMELIYSQMKEILDNHGVKLIETNNKYNPQLHEAMMTGNDESKEDNEILEVFQKGYIVGERVIRHAKVKVNRLDNQNEKTNQNSKEEKVDDNNKAEENKIDENKDKINKSETKEENINSSED